MLFYQKEQQIQGLKLSVLWRMMWQIAGKIIKPSSVVSLLWFIFWRKACLNFSRKYQEACFVTHKNGPYFDTVARHSWSEDCNSHSGGSVATGSLPSLTGQRWWPRWKRIPWSSRLVAGRETDSLIEKPSKIHVNNCSTICDYKEFIIFL